MTIRMMVGAALALLGAGVLATPVSADDFARRWGPSVELGGRISDGRSLGETSLFAPLWQNRDTLLFTDIRGMADDDSASEGNFGLGVRHMLESGWNLGAYGYFDVRRSGLGNTFHQATFGVEALSEFLDLRANVYLPLGDREKVIDLGSWSSTSISATPVLTGTQLGIQTVSTTTTGTATLVEKAMRGVDAESACGFRCSPRG